MLIYPWLSSKPVIWLYPSCTTPYCLPMHTCIIMVLSYPSLQSQIKFPGVFRHVPSPHTPCMMLHSSISENLIILLTTDTPNICLNGIVQVCNPSPSFHVTDPQKYNNSFPYKNILGYHYSIWCALACMNFYSL